MTRPSRMEEEEETAMLNNTSPIDTLVSEHMSLSRFLEVFLIHYDTSSVKARRRLLEHLEERIKETDDWPLEALNTVCQVLCNTLPVYTGDGWSITHVLGCIRQLLSTVPSALPAAVSSVVAAARSRSRLRPSRGAAKTSLANLKLTVTLLDVVAISDMNKELLMAVLQSQATFALIVLGSDASRLVSSARQKLRQLWHHRPDLVQVIVDSLVNHDMTKTSTLVLLSELNAFLSGKEGSERTSELFISQLVKLVISSKEKCPLYLIQSLTSSLKLISHGQFGKYLLPAMLKALLRSPETILDTVATLLGLLNIDLSEYAKELQKPFSLNIHAKADDLRDFSCNAIASLSSQVSDSEILLALIKNLFNLYNGSEGKLTAHTQKMSVLKGIGNCSINAVTGTQAHQTLNDGVIQQFVSVLEKEAHEGTLLVALDALSRWLLKLTGPIPTTLLTWFPKALIAKNTTPLVRCSYLLLLRSALQSSSEALSSSVGLLEPLLKYIDTGSRQQSNQSVVMAEMSHAASCIAHLANLQEVDANKVRQEFWKPLLDHKKQILFNSKYLYTSSPQVLESLCDVAITAINSFDEISNLTDEIELAKKHIYSVLATALLQAPSVKHIQNVLKTTLRGLGGQKCALKLMAALNELLEHRLNVVTVPSNEDKNENVSTHVDAVIQAIIMVASAVGSDFSGKRLLKEQFELKDDFESLLHDLITLSCHPVVKKRFPKVVYKASWKLGFEDLKGLKKIPELMQKALNMISEDDSSLRREIGCSVISLLSERYPNITCTFFTNLVHSKLTSSTINITAEEYAIYLTREGVLFDESVVQTQQSSKETNIKRESKAYSYREQMEEIALRRELEEKKRREGKLAQPKLTPKQIEAKKAQLHKESQIRGRVESIKNEVQPVLRGTLAAIKGCPSSFTMVIQDLISDLKKGFSTPIASELSALMFYTLRKSVFLEEGEESLSQAVAFTSVCLMKPVIVSKLDKGSILNEVIMDDKQVRTMTKSVLQRIAKATIGNYESNNNDDADDDDDFCVFSTPGLAYSFGLIDYVARQCISKDEKLLLKCLRIVQEHVSLRGSENDDDEDEDGIFGLDDLHPKYLPRLPIANLLLDVVEKCEGKPQFEAVEIVVELASGGAGTIGCCLASNEEVNRYTVALQNDSITVREAGIRALRACGRAPQSHVELRSDIARRVFIARFDNMTQSKKTDEDEDQTSSVAEGIRDCALHIWSNMEFSMDLFTYEDFLTDITHPVSAVRMAAGEALRYKLQEQGEQRFGSVLKMLTNVYYDHLGMTKPQLDAFGRIVKEPIDLWEARQGIAQALTRVAALLDPESVEELARFLVPDGLGDRHTSVQHEMLQAGLQMVQHHGSMTADLLPVFEDFLENAPSSQSYDIVRQGVVILMGSLAAKHLDSTNDPKVRPIMRQLILALNTPSQAVQEAVARCLPPLVPAIREDAPPLMARLLDTLLGPKVGYGERKGAAYGIAGLVKGLGILSLKQLEVMTRLTAAVQDKKETHAREGALLAFEMLCTMLGKLFEPYVVHILPHLLLCFGDPKEHVRQAADDTARAVMRNLSAHGVKLVLPALLNALEEDQWRTKTGSVELLGAMAFCAPKQLSSCLPSIVPKLIAVLSDSHHKVQKAGTEALKQIGSVIRNPEIQAIVPVLLGALQDPAAKTGSCLQTLLTTKFVHFIDAPSLALIMPVVERAFQDRSTETRKMAAQIIGNMYSLTDRKDLSPYLPGIIPGLKTSLLDPVPEVRAVSARALGAMVRGMGESSFEELLPWLMSTLTSESSSVDRSGAAQGLAEVVGGLGIEKMEMLMPDIIRTAERNDIAPHVKDGYIMMFIYMPSVFPEDFKPFIGQIIQPILKALADENEFVRETAYKAGQRLVLTYAESSITMLLPELENGLFDDNWRIRHSSVQLLGDLLYKISGVSGKMSTETAGDDDNFGTEKSQKVITNMLGEERRNRVLAGLYMGRSDVALMVRQASLHVWKVVVPNTPKTLREILPTLFNLLLTCLASNSYDKRQVAARTLGDLVKKLGERVLPEIIPILEDGLNADQAEKRQGVCVGLSEIMTSTSREMVMNYVDSLVPTVRKALLDPLGEVREAAAKTFESLHNVVGPRALDDILPVMLQKLDQDDDEMHDNALDGLKQVMAIKPRAVMPFLVPKLIAKPVRVNALASLAPVAGEALHRHLHKILPALIEAISDAERSGDAHMATSVIEHSQIVVLSISSDESELGINVVMEELLTACQASEREVQRAAVSLLHAFCARTKVDYTQYVSQLFRVLILTLTSEDNLVLREAWNALAAVTKSLDPKKQMDYVGDVRQAVRFALMDIYKSKDRSKEMMVLLPGFCLPKGIQPVLPIFREALLNGPPEQKEQAASGLGELIAVTSAEALKPSVVHITGPLIRILGDRFSPNVKIAVLDTLALLLERTKEMLKPFFPQLQTTFTKALNDPHRTVRLKAGAAIGHLIVIHMRPEPLFTELSNGVKNNEDVSIKDTYLNALRGCIEGAGDRIASPILRKQIKEQLTQLLGHTDDSTRACAGGCVGALVKWMPDSDFIDSHIMANSDDWTVRHGRSTALFVALKVAPQNLDEGKVVEVLASLLTADRVPLVENGLRGCAYLLDYNLKSESIGRLALPMSKTMNHVSNEVKQLLASVAVHLASGHKELPNALLKPLMPMLVNGTKEKNAGVKSSSELALVTLLAMTKASEDSERMRRQQQCFDVLEQGGKDALKDVMSRSLEKMAARIKDSDINETLDTTLLT